MQHGAWMSVRWLERCIFPNGLHHFEASFPLAAGQRSPTNASRNKSISRFREELAPTTATAKRKLGYWKQNWFSSCVFCSLQQKLLFPRQFFTPRVVLGEQNHIMWCKFAVYMEGKKWWNVTLRELFHSTFVSFSLLSRRKFAIEYASCVKSHKFPLTYCTQLAIIESAQSVSRFLFVFEKCSNEANWLKLFAPYTIHFPNKWLRSVLGKLRNCVHRELRNKS
jgi:hypothetical protein